MVLAFTTDLVVDDMSVQTTFTVKPLAHQAVLCLKNKDNEGHKSGPV